MRNPLDIGLPQPPKDDATDYERLSFWRKLVSREVSLGFVLALVAALLAGFPVWFFAFLVAWAGAAVVAVIVITVKMRRLADR